MLKCPSNWPPIKATTSPSQVVRSAPIPATNAPTAAEAATNSVNAPDSRGAAPEIQPCAATASAPEMSPAEPPRKIAASPLICAVDRPDSKLTR